MSSLSRLDSIDGVSLAAAAAAASKGEERVKQGSSQENEEVKKVRILYIEDNPFHYELMKSFNEGGPLDFTIATTGQKGVSLATDYEYDIILMDVHLAKPSEYDGYEAARRIKQIKPHMTILSFSSEPMKQKEELGEGIMNGHLEKHAFGIYWKIFPYLSPQGKIKEQETHVNAVEGG